MHTWTLLLSSLASLSSVVVTSTALAQPAPEEPAETPTEAPAEQSVEDRDGARFRGGVNATFGGLFGSREAVSFTGFTGGVDGHIGVQINDLIGIYAVPHLAFGSVTLEAGGLESGTEWLVFAGTGVIDFTFIDRIFVGVGGGGALQAPTCVNCQALGGGTLHLLAGGYPVQGFGEDGIRRTGLMIGIDFRINFVEQLSAPPEIDTSIVLLEPMLMVGYEAF